MRTIEGEPGYGEDGQHADDEQYHDCPFLMGRGSLRCCGLDLLVHSDQSVTLDIATAA